MKKLFILSIVALNLFGQGTTDPSQRLGPSSSVTPRVFFGTAPSAVTGNKPGDFFITPAALYLCTATAGTAAPACSTVMGGSWQIAGTFIGNIPDLTISLSHSGNFTQGQTGATYTIGTSNVGLAPTVGTVTVNAVPPAGLNITSLSGTGWTCSIILNNCTRTDSLAPSASYPSIFEVITVSPTAATSLTNVVNIAGGGETGTSNDGATDVTTINPSANPDLTILLSHTGNFTQGQTGATYSIVVTNVGGASTSGTVTVTDTAPAGLTATAMAGTGWSCTFGTGVCTRSSALASNASYPTITYTVNVSGTAQPVVTNTVNVTGGGDINTANNVSSDPTTITGSGIPISDAFPGSTLNGIWTVKNPAGGTVTVSGGAAHLAVPGGANHDPTDSGMDQSLRIAQTISNVDFQATVEFTSVPSQAFQFEGFFAKQDTDMNFMRFQFGSDGTILECNANVVLAGVQTDPIHQTITGSPSALWLRVTRSGTLWSEFYSLDGVGYNLCGTAVQSFTINEFDIWAGNFNNTPASSPAFTANAVNFVGATNGGGGGGVTCDTTVVPANSTATIQTAITAMTAGQTLCFGVGTYTQTTFLTLKAGVTYTGAGSLGATILNVTNPPVFKLAGTGTVVSNLVMNGGGFEVTATANVNITGNIIRNLNLAGQQTGIYQDPVNSNFLSGSIDHNQFTNIYGPGELTCDGTFPPAGGQPCDYSHDGIDLFLINNLTINHNIFNTISGDAYHLFQNISCADIFGTGPGGNQPNNSFTFNQIQFNHRIPIELQPCHMTNSSVSSNLITGTYIPNAWNIAISFAAGVGAQTNTITIANNYVDGASSTGPGWGIVAPGFEVGGTGTIVSGNSVTTANASSGFSYLKEFTSIFGNAIAYSNNQYCGPSMIFGTYDSSQCGVNGVGCTPYTSVNDKYTVSCAGFPTQTITGN